MSIPNNWHTYATPFGKIFIYNKSVQKLLVTSVIHFTLLGYYNGFDKWTAFLHFTKENKKKKFKKEEKKNATTETRENRRIP